MTNDDTQIEPQIIAAAVARVHGIQLASLDAERVAGTLAQAAATLHRLTAAGLFDTEPGSFYDFLDAQASEGRQ